MLPETIKRSLPDKKIFDFGIKINNNFGFHNNYCELPSLLVIAYSLAVANSGQADQIILAGFDGYKKSDVDRDETEELFSKILKKQKNYKIMSLTKSKFKFLKTLK